MFQELSSEFGALGWRDEQKRAQPNSDSSLPLPASAFPYSKSLSGHFLTGFQRTTIHHARRGVVPLSSSLFARTTAHRLLQLGRHRRSALVKHVNDGAEHLGLARLQQ